MGILNNKIRLDVTRELFNDIMAEINQYIDVMLGCDDEITEALRLKCFMECAKLKSDSDGNEYAHIDLPLREAEDMIYILALVGSTHIECTEEPDEYARIKAARER